MLPVQTDKLTLFFRVYLACFHGLWAHLLSMQFIYVQRNSVISYPQGKLTRYILNKVRFIQNAIFPAGTTGFTCKLTWRGIFVPDLFCRSSCSREQSTTENASKFWMSVTRFSLLERWSHLSGYHEHKNVQGNWHRNWKRVDNCIVIRKKTSERAKKCSWRVNWNVTSDTVPCSVRLIKKNVHISNRWCSWSTESTKYLSVRTNPYTYKPRLTVCWCNHLFILFSCHWSSYPPHHHWQMPSTKTRNEFFFCSRSTGTTDNTNQLPARVSVCVCNEMKEMAATHAQGANFKCRPWTYIENFFSQS